MPFNINRSVGALSVSLASFVFSGCAAPKTIESGDAYVNSMAGAGYVHKDGEKREILVTTEGFMLIDSGKLKPIVLREFKDDTGLWKLSDPSVEKTHPDLFRKIGDNHYLLDKSER